MSCRLEESRAPALLPSFPLSRGGGGTFSPVMRGWRHPGTKSARQRQREDAVRGRGGDQPLRETPADRIQSPSSSFVSRGHSGVHTREPAQARAAERRANPVTPPDSRRVKPSRSPARFPHRNRANGGRRERGVTGRLRTPRATLRSAGDGRCFRPGTGDRRPAPHTACHPAWPWGSGRSSRAGKASRGHPDGRGGRRPPLRPQAV